MPIVAFKDLRPGMKIAEHIVDPNGTFLVAPGQVLTQAWITRLGRWHIKELNILPPDDEAEQASEKDAFSFSPSPADDFAFKLFFQEEQRIEKKLRDIFLATRLQKTLDIVTLQELVRDQLYPLLSEPKLPVFLHMPSHEADYLYRHAFDCALLSGLLARWLEYPTTSVAQIMLYALLMDIGKLFVSEHVINKPGSLTVSERQEAKEHLNKGYYLLLDGKQLDSASLEALYQHHERLDGSGYPRGLRGAAIVSSARILAIADVYDAIVSPRCYRTGLTPLQAADTLLHSMSSQLDQEMLYCFINGMRRAFIGETVLLSDGSIGRIAAFPPLPLIKPLVVLGNGTVVTLSHDKSIDIVRWETKHWKPTVLPILF